MHGKDSWVLGASVHSLGCFERDKSSKVSFSYYLVGHCKCLWVHPSQTDCFCLTDTVHNCSAVIVKGRSMNTAPFSLSKASHQPEVSSFIPSIYSRPIKFLGHIIDSLISDRNSSAELTDKLLAWLRAIDKSHFTGTQKLLILQHLLIPRIQ